MHNTYCKDCLFSMPVGSKNECKFHIPKMIRDTHDILVKDNYYYIKNYKCFYGFSKNVYANNTDSLTIESIENMVLTKSKIRYYLILDIRSISEHNITEVISMINNLDIKPKYISFISTPNYDARQIFKTINENISKEVRWKLHTFLNTVSLNDCVNISAETNIQSSESSLLLIYDYTKKTELNLNDAVNYMHYNFIVQQINLFGIQHDNLHGLCIPISVYRSLITLVGRDLIKAIQDTPQIKLVRYEIEKSI